MREIPAFFRRRWDGTPHEGDTLIRVEQVGDRLVVNLDAEPDPDMVVVDMLTLAPAEGYLTIYGERIKAWESDLAVVRQKEASGEVYAMNYSVQCVDGEIGFQPLDAIEAISREEFEAARARGWKG